MLINTIQAFTYQSIVCLYCGIMAISKIPSSLLEWRNNKYVCGWRYYCVIVASFFLIIGCSKGSEDTPELIVFAATSLTGSLTEIERSFEKTVNVDVLFSFSGSHALARQIIAGAPADVFISAGDSPLDLLDENGLTIPQSHRSLLSNELVLVVRPETLAPDSLFDLTNTRFSLIAIADPNLAPAGEYAKEALLSAGVWDELSRTEKIVFGTDVRVTLNYVRTGNADAALVYATDAISTRGLEILDVIPKDTYPLIIYPVAAIVGDSSTEWAMAFIAHLKNQQSVNTFLRHGFQTVP